MKSSVIWSGIVSAGRRAGPGQGEQRSLKGGKAPRVITELKDCILDDLVAVIRSNKLRWLDCRRDATFQRFRRVCCRGALVCNYRATKTQTQPAGFPHSRKVGTSRLDADLLASK